MVWLYDCFIFLDFLKTYIVSKYTLISIINNAFYGYMLKHYKVDGTIIYKDLSLKIHFWYCIYYF